MFSLALFLGVYSYFIFILGLSNLLYKEIVLGVLVITVALITIFKRIQIFANIRKFFNEISNFKKIDLLLLTLIFFQAIINLIGVLGPEISFDALWYHLTLPKLYLESRSINYISGGLLYYSTMPKLIELIYVFGLSLGSEIFPKLIHYLFGICCLIAIYKISRMYLARTYSLIAALIFYSNLVVGWESITAYVDLGRAFFEILALWAFLIWIKEKDTKWLVESAVMVGLAISAKLIAIQSLAIYLILITYFLLSDKVKTRAIAKNILLFTLFSLLVPLPWFIFSFSNTGNFVYPFFDKTISLGINFQFPNPLNIFNDLGNLFIYSSDPISPIYLILIPLMIGIYKKSTREFKVISIYLSLALLFWYITPKIGGGRFILPYLPAFSVLSASTVKQIANRNIQKYLIFLVIFTSLVSITYRGVANTKFIPVILKTETKSEFLTKNLNFKFGDFYDIDGYFKQNITTRDKVLLYGFHNLYYIDFPHIDSSWVKKGDNFNYIATQNTLLPERFKNWKLSYENAITGVKLYNLYGLKWHY